MYNLTVSKLLWLPSYFIGISLHFLAWPPLTYDIIGNTVEPPNNGHVGTRHFVLYSEVVFSSEVKNVLV